MTPGELRRGLALGISWKVGLPLFLGLVTLVSADSAGMTGRDALELAGLVTAVLMIAVFVVNFEIRLSGLDHRMDTGFTATSRSGRMLDLAERSALDTGLLTDLLTAAGEVDEAVSPLLRSLARHEIERLTWFIRQLPGGSEIGYDGEDREWMLGLTAEATCSIDAISLSTVDAGMRGFDGGMWTSDLGTRYLDLQREAIARGVRVRRIFVVERDDLAQDETFLRITSMQGEVGVEVRKLDYHLIPELLRTMIFDFIVFDGSVCYESTPATTFPTGRARPAILRTHLAPMSDRVRDLQKQFDELWKAADPKRELPGRQMGD